MNQHISNYFNLIAQMAQYINDGNMAMADKIKEEAEREYNLYKEETYNEENTPVDMLYGENKNFGVLNAIFLESMPELFKSKTGRKAIKEYVDLIKEDENLSKQYIFYNAIINNNNPVDSKEFVKESIDFIKDVNKKTLVESNDKLLSLIKKYNINENIDIDEETLKLFEDCEYVILNKKKLSNLGSYLNHVNSISLYVENHASQETITEQNSNIEDIDRLVNEFNNKYSSILNEAEIGLVKDIMDAKANNNLEKKENLFNSFRNECIDLVNKMLIDENESSLRERLTSIKEQLNTIQFNENTLVKDIANLLELKEVLLSN